MNIARRHSGFTLVELLVVISILGILAALTVPALKNLGKSNVTVSAARQLLDDVGRARLLAIGHHTTVYMVFVSTNFWTVGGYHNNNPSSWWGGLTTAQQSVVTNLCGMQLSGYTFVSLRSAGDQPGQGKPHYLAPWQNLPEGAFIASQKFQASNSPPSTPFYISAYNPNIPIYGFSTALRIPFPTEDSALPSLPYFPLPYIAFNYLGQLTLDGQSLAYRDEYIPLAQGTVSPTINGTTKAINMLPMNAGAATISETPPGNSTNSMFNLIHIDRLTGRARLEFQKVQ